MLTISWVSQLVFGSMNWKICQMSVMIFCSLTFEFNKAVWGYMPGFLYSIEFFKLNFALVLVIGQI